MKELILWGLEKGQPKYMEEVLAECTSEVEKHRIFQKFWLYRRIKMEYEQILKNKIIDNEDTIEAFKDANII